MRRICIIVGISLFLGLLPAGLLCLRLDGSATDTALSGLQIAPQDSTASLRCGYQSLFSQAGINLYSLSFELLEGSRRYQFGFVQLSSDDYRQQEYALGLAQSIGWATLYFVQNLSTEVIGPDEALQSWYSDLALELKYKSCGLWLLSKSIFSAERTVQLQFTQSLADRMILGAGLKRDEYEDISWSLGSSYRVSDAFYLLSSWQHEPPRLGVGADFRLGKIGLLYAVRTHSRLDPTHALDLSYRW